MKNIYKRIISFVLTVCMLTSSFGDIGLLADAAFGVFRLTQRLKATDGTSYEVTVRYGAESGIPRNAVLKVESLADGDDALYRDYLDRSLRLADTGAEEPDFARVLDISLLDPTTGEEIQPDQGVRVSVRLLGAPADEIDAVNVVHFDDMDAEAVESSVSNTTVAFQADSFSVYVLYGYTVDFHWDDYTYSIEGRSKITLSALLKELGVTEITTADVSGVRFSNPKYIAIEQTRFDWLLRSLAPFNTEETLTLTLKNGKRVEIRVTDEGEEPVPPTAKENLVYNGEAQELIVAGTGEEYQYCLSENGEFTDAIPTGKDADTYTVYYKAKDNDVAPPSLSVTIAKADVTVTANDASKIVGEEDPELTAAVTGLIGGDTITYTLSREPGDTVGTYVITVTGEAEQGNYVVTYAPGTFTIAKEPLKPLTITTASESKEYDGYELSNHGYTADGLTAGDTIRSIVFDGAQTDAGTSENVARVEIIENAVGENVTDSYDITYVPGTLTVTPKPITITADSAEKTYDGTALTDTGYTTTGLADGDVFDGVTVTGSQTLVGESKNTPSAARIVRPVEGDEIVEVNNNYIIGYVQGTLEVKARPLTVTADSASKGYDGKALTKESYTVEGLAEGDSVQTVTVTGSQTDAGTGENVPSEAVIVNSNGDVVTKCYDISYVSGTLEVTRKAVKLTAVSGVQVYDGSEKTVSGFTVSADGWGLSGITFADTVSASGSGTDRGSYAVTFSGVTLNETTDTTGNYVVTETENGTLRITENKPIEKEITFNGNEAFYTITVNPDGLTLNGGNYLTLKDTFTDNQSIDYSSVNPSDDRVTYDYSGYTGTFVIPDATPLIITYHTRVSGAAGKSVKFGNTAELGVTKNGSFAKWCEASTSYSSMISPTGTDIDGTDGVYSIRLFVYPQNHMEKGLGGSVFRLLDSNQRPVFYRAGERAGELVTFTTGDDGYATVALDDGIVSIHKNTAYYLEMITAPVAHNADDSYTYYQKDNTLYNFLITDDPSYDQKGVYSYFNGDVLKVRCYPEAAGINITKRFSGNYTLTDAQKNRIRFVLQKEDLASDRWVDVEEHTYAEFSYGSINFSTGRAGGPPLEQAVMYRVIEENSELGSEAPGVDHSSSVVLTYQRDNQRIQEYSNEFMADPDHSTYSFSLVFDNNYVDHKLTLVKMNELTGALLPGAEFTVYTARDNTPVKTYVTDSNGAVVIRRDDEGANFAPDTAYYAVETAAPEGYLEPHAPEKIYFYFSEASAGVPAGIPIGMTAVDLTTTYDTVIVANHDKTVTVPVTVTWALDGSNEWPNGVNSVISLYQSVNGSEPEPVEREGNPMTVTLNRDKTFDNTTFVNLPARDEYDNDITYSVRQNDLPAYYTSYKVSGTGWYVVRNESAVSVTVKKEWYGLDGTPVSDAGGKDAVAFDLYRTTEDHPITTRDSLEAILRGLEPVRTGLTLSAGKGWTNTVNSLQKRNEDGDIYYYFALEREDSMPRNNEDSYAIVPADGEDLRTLTVRNTQTPITVIIRADDLTKEYGHDNPEFSFYTEVQDDDCEVSEPVPVPGEDGKYTVTVTDGSGNPKTITFTCSRETGEDVGSYAIELSGESSQEGYRVRLDDGELTITPAQVTVKGTATKVYGDPDPSLVEITGMKEGDTIAYYAYRDIGEQKGSYRIYVTGLAKQGNYEITYINDYLTIAPAPVTVTADSISKAYGQADPALTVTIDGLKNNDAPSVIKYTISRDKQGTPEGESVADYVITVTGDENQGNYTVAFVNGTFTITGHKVTVRAKNLSKTYGEADPTWEAEVTGLREGETLEYSFTREEGEDVGTYVVTPVGETKQGNAEVIYETGILTINKANLTVTPENYIKALTDPVTPDPQLTVSFEGMAERDKGIVPTVVYDEGTKTWTYTYTREGKTEPEFGFTLTRTPGETAGPYVIAATAFGERPRNYNITYKTGIFTILTTYNVVLTQQTRDLVDYAQNPEYTYKAVLDPTAIGIETYNAGGFVNNKMTFTLPADGSSSKTLPIPSGAKLTVTQETENRDYTTAITLDSKDVEGTSVLIEKVNKAASIVVTHERITLPVEARAAKQQTAEETADENGAVAVTPLAYLGIPRDTEKNPIPQPAAGDDGFIHALDVQGVYNLPEDKYYVPEHASVYNGGTAVATAIQAIRYDEENKVWQYSTDGSDFTAFQAGDQLELFYMPKYICRVQEDGQSFYTLNEALAHIHGEHGDTGVIEMLLESYTMPAADALTIPENYDITLTTAKGLESPAVILRKPSFGSGHMLTNKGNLTLGSIVIDGNKDRVTASEAMVLNNGTLTVSGAATLQNAAGNNGGAIYAASGSVTVEAGASITGNRATNGGAIYLFNGSLSIATENITGNTATNGGAIYMAGGTFEQTNSITGNSATNGGAVYVSGGTLKIGGSVSGTAASGGAVFMTGGTVSVTDGTVSGSTAENGGAFYMEGGSLNMFGGTVSGNIAQSSGGMLYATGGTVTVSGGTVSGNTAVNGNGGAICYGGSGMVTVSGGTVSGNKAENGLGGAIYQSSGETKLSAGNINGSNMAINGAAVYTAGGITNMTGVSITGNIATDGGAVGMAAGTKLNLSGNTKISDNKNTAGEKRNVYLNVDSDEIINVPLDLGSNNIGIYVADNVRSKRGEACCSFGGYVSTTNLSKITDDRGIYTEYNYNNKLYWGKPVKFIVRYLPNGEGFPPNTTSGTQLYSEKSYYPKTTENQIYSLVNLLYDTYYNDKIQTGYVYAYTYRNGETAFGKYITSIDWDAEARQWVYKLHDGTTYTNNNNARIIIYYADAAYISIVNNSGYDLTIDPLTVMGKTAVGDGYGYTAVINNVTQKTLLPITRENLTIPKDCSVRLLFPGAKGSAWSLDGVFDAAEGSAINYTLNRAGGGTEQPLSTTTTEDGLTFSLNANLLSDAGGIYEILFGDPTPICKVENGGVEHPFTSLNLAKDYIVSSGLTCTYTKLDGTTITKPGGTIEMLLDYQQPKTDILAIPEGYHITLTTAAAEGSAEAEGKTYTYVGDDPTRATISRSSGDMGSAVTSEIKASTAVLTNDECTTSVTIDGIIFDGKALGQGGEGGAIKTANTIVNINRCDFKGYTATRGGAIYVKWGRLTVENSDFTNCKILSNQDKTGGGGIWTTAHDLIVRNCSFVNCDCTQYPKNGSAPQAGAVFHNIRYDGAVVHPSDSQKFPTGFSKGSTTRIEGCTFKDCIATGSGGTVESDAWLVDIENCTFHGSQTTKSGGNGGAVNIYTNDNKNIDNSTYLNVINCWFEDCSATNGTTNGGAIRTLCKSVKLSGTTIINAFSNNTGGALSMTNTGTKLEIYGCTFDNCRANESSGAVYAKAATLTVGDSESYMSYNTETKKYEVVNGTRHTSFTDCTSKKYGGINHDQTGNVTVTNATFTRCTTTNGTAGALYTATKNLTITGTSFVNCTATLEGGAVYNNNSGTSQTLTNCVFDGCSSGKSGGGAYLAAGTTTVSGGEVKNCYATNNGGGLYISPTTATFTDDYSFDNNWVTASDSKGGALFINQGTVTLTGGTVNGSKAAYGGGIYSQGTLTINKGTAENSGTITNCVARTSGGGIYGTGSITLSDAVISECYAKTSGGGIYHTGELKPYGKITKCYAEKGGGVYSANGKLTVSDTTKSMEISNCHAATVTIADDGTVTAEKEYKPENQGGGIYRSATDNDGTISTENAVIKGCSAYDGGGLYYNSSKTLSFSAGKFYGNTATNNGGAIYKNGTGSVTMSGGVIGGSAENANHAQYGSAIFVADGQKITLGGGRITHNVAEVGGAIAVGGNNANTQLLFQGAPVIRNNTNANGVKCNVYLNYDTNDIIRTTSTPLSAGAYIGVYVTEEQFGIHGDYGKPFGTYVSNSGLGSFFNDRIYAGGKQGSNSNQIVWGEFVCKIIDADGNLLYIDTTCEAPAVYTTLENNGNANTTSAFGMLSNNTVNLYNANGIYSGDYQIQMLVDSYTCVERMSLPSGKTITLTTAEKDAEDGFPFTGTGEFATIYRGGTFNNSWITNRGDLTLKEVTMDGQNKESNDGTSNSGGIICNKDSGILRIKANATLRNSGTKTAGGGAVGLYGSTSELYMEGGLIENCFASNSGGAVLVQNAGAKFYMSGGSIVNCSAKNGGAVYGTGKIYMSGGEITGNSATVEAGGIDLRNEIRFSGNPVISGNTLNGNPCNVHLINNNNTSIYADGLGPFAEIRVYTAGNVYNGHGEKGDPFGTWTNNENLHCFINDVTPALRGMKTTDDKLIYWRDTPFLSVGKVVESDWSADKDKEFDFTVTLIKPDQSGIYEYSGSYENMTFVNGVATFKLKAGEVRTAIGLPFEFIHNGVYYTVTETLAEGQTAYTTTYSHNGGASVEGTEVTGHFGENMSEDPLTSSSVSSVIFTNTRAKDDLTVSKTVTEGITGDYTMPFTFTVTLKDDTISKFFNAKLYQDQTDTTGTDETVTFTGGVAEFQLTHGQSIKIIGLPTELGFKVEEKLTDDQYANFRAYVTAGSAEEISYSASGTVGKLKNVAFRNNRYGLVCKIVNDTVGREQLYYWANNDDSLDPTPAIFDELEKAFETISDGINFFTTDGASADVKLRLEMVKPQYVMNRQAELANGYNVTLGTAQKTDRLYPYPTDADPSAMVTRGYEGGSLIVDNGNLTIDNITLDGVSNTYTSTENGGIVQVNGAQTLTVTERAILRNSVSSGNGGAIWIGATAGLTMNGAITDCEAAYGGGVYANNGFGGVTGEAGYLGVSIGGTISGSKATAGNGGAIYAGTATIPDNIPNAVPMVLTGSATLSGNRAVSVEGNNETGRGGALYCATAVEINSENVTISGNTADKDGGGIYQSADSGSFTMNGGIISNNTAAGGNAGGIRANHITITGGAFSGNKANSITVIEDGEEKTKDGKGGAIYTRTGANVSITGATFTDNEAYQGGAVYDQAKSFTVENVTMTGNSAIKNGGAVYVSSVKTEGDSVITGPFNMSGGSISGNSSPEGAISTGETAVLNFSGDAKVFGNTADDGTTAMNVFLGYHSNTIINANNLIGSESIGVYVANGDGKIIYNNHGIANRPFGTGSGENLGKFVNDRDNTLTGVHGSDGLIMWPGKNLVIQVYQNKANPQGQKTTPVGGAQFSLANGDGVTVWSGESNPSIGLITVPWGVAESENGGAVTLAKWNENNVIPVTYVLSQQRANEDTVLPAGKWKVTVGTDNTVTWEVIEPVDGEGNSIENVNRTLPVTAQPDDPEYVAHIGEVFLLYNDVKPKITFDPNGGILYGKEDESPRTDTVNFSLTEPNHTYKIEEHNPTRSNSVFRAWSTVKNPVEGDGHMEFKQGGEDEILFYRHSDNDDVTLYALWTTVVCKITDRDDNLLYINGSPAVYMTLKAGFDEFNDGQFTLKDGTKATPRKIKMLVGDYEMTQTVELERGKIAEFMTAPSTDTDGYTGPTKTCVITRASTFDSGSMIVNNYTLAIRNLILDGSVKDGTGAVKTIDGNGGIVTVRGNASHLTLAQDVTLRNATVSGKGGAVYAYGNTNVTISTGSRIIGCQAADGGAIYADKTVYEGGADTPAVVNISGGEISGNKAAAEGEESRGGAIYATGAVNMTGGSVKNNTDATYGGGLYLAQNGELTMTGGSISGNAAAQSGGGVYSDGSVKLNNKAAVISGNAATQSGGGVYVGSDGSLAISNGAVGANGSPNTAPYGSGVYLAGNAQLTGGSISYNGSSNTKDGGGLYLISKENITLNGTELSHNQAENGGAVYAAKPSGGAPGDEKITLTLAKGTISNNTASGNGGGVYLSPELKLCMIGGTLGKANTANYGGGVYVRGDFEFSGGSLNTNTAKKDGGGAYVASDGSMSVIDDDVHEAEIKGNKATNGAAVCVEGTDSGNYGTLHMETGTISENKADNVGGAVYLKNYAEFHISDGTISGNSASGGIGGAINVEDGGGDARIYLSGSPSIFNNPGRADTTSQRNLVLSEDSSGIIRTEAKGLTGGTVGVYVISDHAEKHGVYNTPFGTFADSDENRENAKYLVNDRDLALYGVTKGDNTIYWLDVVCKVTNNSDLMLYKYVPVNGTSIRAYVSAVYTSLEDGLKAVSGSLYRKSGSRFAMANTGAVKVKMLQDYELDENELITYRTARSLTLTTAETQISTSMRNNGDTYVFTPRDGDPTRATLTRNQSRASMFTVNTPKNVFDVADLIIDGGSNTMMTEPNVDGGAFNIQAVSSSTFTGVTMKNLNATGNGGAIYLQSGSLTLKVPSSITGSSATNGGAVYVAGGSVTMRTCTVNGNTAEENGAGYYLASGGSLSLIGEPYFGGSGVENGVIVQTNTNGSAAGNFVRRGVAFKTEEREPTNGGMEYLKDGEDYLVRQDIYIEGAGAPHTALRVTDKITSGKGTIWVWAEQQDHYEMLKQFAVFEGSGLKLNDGDKDASIKVFRNAQPDSKTICIGDYLTGQRGEKANCIYWTGGYDVVFLKADGYGVGLPGVVFKLYTDAACKSEYNMTFQDGKRSTTISSDGTATYKDKNGKTATLLEGEVLLSKVPPRTFYLKETATVNGYQLDSTVYQVVISDSGELTMKKSADGKEVFKEKRPAMVVDENTVELEQYVIINIPDAERKVILRKTSVSNDSLQGAQFQMFRYNGTIVSAEGSVLFTSGANGVYFVGKLPYGTYYLYEKTAPSGYAAGKWFRLTIDENTEPGSRNGVAVAEISDEAKITQLHNFL